MLVHRSDTVKHFIVNVVANISGQARWALSKDEFLQERGLNTGIDWHAELESYFQYLLQGLQQHKASVLNIFRVWDETFFPITNTSLSGRRDQISNNERSTRDALDALNADKEDLGDNENEGHGDD